ncbi:SUMF1/EgtB/PvdO family nonheme iron enzyme [bacterium]|nr:SUMF1/EgtB/PvdO family nonheme iron enzyme [bacterium]
MEIEDWNLALVIALCAVVWMKIFADYRKKMMRVLPTVDQVAHRKQEFGNKIAQAENLAREITVGIDEMREQIEDLESKRQKLQDKLNERDMIFIPAGRLKMGTDQSGHDDENPQHDVQIKAFCLDRYAVTNLQYKDFMAARRSAQSLPRWRLPHQPHGYPRSVAALRHAEYVSGLYWLSLRYEFRVSCCGLDGATTAGFRHTRLPNPHS